MTRIFVDFPVDFSWFFRDKCLYIRYISSCKEFLKYSFIFFNNFLNLFTFSTSSLISFSYFLFLLYTFCVFLCTFCVYNSSNLTTFLWIFFNTRIIINFINIFVCSVFSILLPSILLTLFPALSSVSQLFLFFFLVYTFFVYFLLHWQFNFLFQNYLLANYYIIGTCNKFIPLY